MDINDLKVNHLYLVKIEQGSYFGIAPRQYLGICICTENFSHALFRIPQLAGRLHNGGIRESTFGKIYHDRSLYWLSRPEIVREVPLNQGGQYSG